MRRFNSLGCCKTEVPSSSSIENQRSIPDGKRPLVSSKSLPNIELFFFDEEQLCNKCTGCNSSNQIGIKRQNSRRKKIFQKTWDKVKTIINYPQVRRNSKIKQSSDPPLSASPTTKPFKLSNQSSSAPATPRNKLVFDFEPPFASAPATASTPSSSKGNERSIILPNEPQPGTSSGTLLENSSNSNIEDQVVKHYVELQKRLSDELHQSINKQEATKPDEALSEDFKKRLQQWEMWKASTGKFHYTEEQLQKIIPLEFSKKLQEWEELKTRPREEILMKTSELGGHSGTTASSSSHHSSTRKKKKKTEESHRQKELAWLEKQLEKIDMEKKRLEREMVKYCERELRLQKMREALRNNFDLKQDVWIRTPTAECKLEGINEKFTKKLYKWEEKQRIQPECSTIALLSPKYITQMSSDRSYQETEAIEASEQNIPLSSPSLELLDERLEHPLCIPKEYSSQSEASEADEEYEEATDSYATKDEPASGTSNTDSDCFNLKPGFRRRSSDGISSPLSSARSPSPSFCTSDDDENIILEAVNENEEDGGGINLEEKPAVVKAKKIVVEDDFARGVSPSSSAHQNNSLVIVKTQRTIFTPVSSVPREAALVDNTNPLFQPSQRLSSPTLVRNACEGAKSTTLPSTFEEKLSISGPSSTHSTQVSLWERREKNPPRIVGVIRKSSSGISNASSAFTNSKSENIDR